jgi:glutaredoxin
VAFQYLDVLADKEELKRMLQYSKGARIVPVIVEEGRVILGYAGGS